MRTIMLFSSFLQYDRKTRVKYIILCVYIYIYIYLKASPLPPAPLLQAWWMQNIRSWRHQKLGFERPGGSILIPWGIIFASQGPQGHPTAWLCLRIRNFMDFLSFLGSSWEPLFHVFLCFFVISGAKIAGWCKGLVF